MSILNNIGILKFYNKIKMRYITSIISMGGGNLKLTFGDNTTTSLNLPIFKGSNTDSESESGLVPVSSTEQSSMFLRGDGTWGEAMPIGYEYFQFNPNVQPGSLSFLGGEYSREEYPKLWDWVQRQTGYLKTEDEWQTISSSNGGNVPFYSSGDGSTTFRVPCIKCWVKADSTVGTYLKPGLPNITGRWSTTWNTPIRGFHGLTTSGAYYNDEDSSKTARWLGKDGDANTGTRGHPGFDASRSNSIYGSSSEVQPRSVTGIYCVIAKTV